MSEPDDTADLDTTGRGRPWPRRSAWDRAPDQADGRPRTPRCVNPSTSWARASSRRQSPLKGYGSKTNLVSTIVPLLPTHKRFVEVFGGTGAVLFSKPPVANEVYNDLNHHLVEFFEVLRDGTNRDRLARLLRDTPYSREEYRRCAARFDAETDPVERARQFYVLTHQSLNGRCAGGWSRDRRANRARRFRNGQGLLDQASRRLKHVVLENREFENIIGFYDAETTLFYLDPPYLPETRSAPRRYDHEMTREDHERLLSVITKVKGMVLLSGYSHPLYEGLLNGWDRIEIQVPCSSTVLGKGDTTRPVRFEIIWANYDLHARG